MNERYPTGRRAELAQTFNTAADRYDRFRPRYPNALFDALTTLSGSGAQSQVLEVGPATGVATDELAQRFGAVTALEPGPALAASASTRLSHANNVAIIVARLEDWVPPQWHSFDLVAAATSWHWVDPEAAYALAHRHLRPGGALAFWSALHVAGRDSFFDDIQEVYDAIGESRPGDSRLPLPGELAEHRHEVDASGLFETVDVVHFDWEVTYSAEAYLGLLSTFSGHIAMQVATQEALFDEIRQRINARPDGVVHRHWGAALHVARRR